MRGERFWHAPRAFNLGLRFACGDAVLRLDAGSALPSFLLPRFVFLTAPPPDHPPSAHGIRAPRSNRPSVAGLESPRFNHLTSTVRLDLSGSSHRAEAPPPAPPDWAGAGGAGTEPHSTGEFNAGDFHARAGYLYARWASLKAVGFYDERLVAGGSEADADLIRRLSAAAWVGSGTSRDVLQEASYGTTPGASPDAPLRSAAADAPILRGANQASKTIADRLVGGSEGGGGGDTGRGTGGGGAGGSGGDGWNAGGGTPSSNRKLRPAAWGASHRASVYEAIGSSAGSLTLQNTWRPLTQGEREARERH